MAQVKLLNNKNISDPVVGGFYTVREAARLLNIAQPSRVTAWVQGRKTNSAGPVIVRQYEPVENVQEVGFWDLLEVRFIDHFRAQGVSLQSLRKAAQTARAEWKVQHPFATSNIKYMTDRKAIFQATADEVGDHVLLDLVTRQYAMYVVLESVLAKGVTFDAASGLASEWRPKKSEFPDVALSPRVAYGQPAIMPLGLPTSVLFRAWKAEDGDYDAVSDWHEIERTLVEQAVEFELSLPN